MSRQEPASSGAWTVERHLEDRSVEVADLDLQREVRDPRIQRADAYTSRLFVNFFRVTGLAELDEVFAGWLGEAYQVGAGEHMQP